MVGGCLNRVPLLSLELLLRPVTDLGLLLGPLAVGIMVSFPLCSFPVGVGVGVGVGGSGSELSVGILGLLGSWLCLLGWFISLVIAVACERGMGMMISGGSPRAVMGLLGLFSFAEIYFVRSHVVADVAHCLGWGVGGSLVGGLAMWAWVVCGLLNLVVVIVALDMEVFPCFYYLWLLGLYLLRYIYFLNFGLVSFLVAGLAGFFRTPFPPSQVLILQPRNGQSGVVRETTAMVEVQDS